MDNITISEKYIQSLGFKIRYQHFRVFNDLNPGNPNEPSRMYIQAKYLNNCVKTNTMPRNTCYYDMKRSGWNTPEVRELYSLRGGYTVCTLTHENGIDRFVENSICDIRDVFCKKTGREKALKAAFNEVVRTAMHSYFYNQK